MGHRYIEENEDEQEDENESETTKYPKYPKFKTEGNKGNKESNGGRGASRPSKFMFAVGRRSRFNRPISGNRSCMTSDLTLITNEAGQNLHGRFGTGLAKPEANPFRNAVNQLQSLLDAV